MRRNEHTTRPGFVLVMVCLLLVACARQTPASPVTPQPALSYEALAHHYAPVIYQGAASDQDFITAVDFDGDWIGNNNWENQPAGDLSAYVYYSVVESKTHWFIFYSIFHPRDYTPDPCEVSGGCHENDLESIQLVVAKDGTPLGKMLVVETRALAYHASFEGDFSAEYLYNPYLADLGLIPAPQQDVISQARDWSLQRTVVTHINHNNLTHAELMERVTPDGITVAHAGLAMEV